MSRTVDVVLCGAGHNGLVAAILLARRGLEVLVLEEKHQVGGAAKTEYPFAKAPTLGTSTGAYLLGLMPPELLATLQLDLPLRRRDPHYFLPTTGQRYLLFGSDQAAMRAQFLSFFSEADWRANQAAARGDRGAAGRRGPDLAAGAAVHRGHRRAVRAPGAAQVFIDLCRGSVGAYLDRFDFKSDLLKAMYAVTDGVSGLAGGMDTPGSGMNFLVHNMCRLPGADGTWMIVEGGMGTITQRLADAARQAGASIQTGTKVARILHTAGVIQGVALADGTEVRAPVVLVNADPFRMRTLVGQDSLPDDYNRRLDGYLRDGSTFKVNLALRGLPRFRCLPEDRGQYGPTIHLLPDEHEVMASLRHGFAEVQAGRLAPFPTIEWYIHTTVDPTLRDAEGNHNSALFVQWVPYRLSQSSWEQEEERYTRHLLSLCDRFAPGTSELVVDTFALHPAEDREPLRHHPRPHPPRRQQLRLRRPAALRRPRWRASTPAAPAPTRRARSSAPPATTPPSACCAISAVRASVDSENRTIFGGK